MNPQLFLKNTISEKLMPAVPEPWLIKVTVHQATPLPLPPLLLIDYVNNLREKSMCS